MPKFLDTPTWYGEDGEIVFPLRLHLISFYVTAGARNGTAIIHFFNHSSSPITSYSQLLSEMESMGLTPSTTHLICLGEIYSSGATASVDFVRAEGFQSSHFTLNGWSQDDTMTNIMVNNPSSSFLSDMVL